jgi:hypothetical protein
MSNGGSEWSEGSQGDAPDYGGSPGERLVARGEVLMRAEHDSMLAVSVQRPRNPQKVLDAALVELETAPAYASENYYSIPYKDRSGGQEKTVMVEGPSIHLARIVARHWGNCAAKCVITGEDENRVHLSGVFVDLQANVRFERPFTVTKYRYDSNTRKTIALRDDRLMMAVQSGASKAERNAILSGVPRWLVKAVMDRAKKIAANDVQQRIGEVLQAFAQLGVTREMLEKRFDTPLERFDDDQRAAMKGLYNALRDREVSLAEAFADPEPEAATDGPASVADVLAQGATVKGGASTVAGEQPNGATAPAAASGRPAKAPSGSASAKNDSPASSLAPPASEVTF